MTEISVKGAEDFLALSKALKEAGQTDLRKQLHKSMRDSAKPLVKVAKDAALTAGIPRRGGLEARIAKTLYRAQVRTGASTAGVRIMAPGKFVTARMLNATGTFRHPVFGNPKVWVSQSAPSAVGFFDKAMLNNAGEIRKELNDALDRVRREVLRSI